MNNRLPVYWFIGNGFSLLDNILAEFQLKLIDDQGSNPLSKLLRPLFEHRRFQAAFGLNLIIALVLFGYSSLIFPSNTNVVFADFPSGAIEPNSELVVVSVPKEVVITERRYQIPVDLIGVSQGFHSHHHGVDLRAAYGSDIHPITEGVVRSVIHSNWGYGQAVIIDHADQISSMYAHAGNIFVDPGSNVDQETVIAQIGMTGSTTGPHLHLEIYKNGAAVDPQPFLGY